MARQREHNEHFRPVSLKGRKSCPNCRTRLEPGESWWSWGEYVRAKWRTIRHFGKCCWPEIRGELNAHTDGCGCTVNLCVHGAPQPDWMTLEVPREMRACAGPFGGPGVGAVR